ncbi:hypothetical protein NXW91_23745 [Bacteroides fragilis]|nr:hypothetical protein [Bacteroides fragilis]
MFYGVHPFYHGQDSPRKYHLKRWTEENRIHMRQYPRIYSASSVHTTYNRNFSDYHLFDSDYFRFKNSVTGIYSTICNSEELGITVIESICNRRENLFTVRADKKRWKTLDPETAGGVDLYAGD